MESNADFSWLDDVRLPNPLDIADGRLRELTTRQLGGAELRALGEEINRDFHRRRMVYLRSLHADATPAEFREFMIDHLLNGDPDEAWKAWVYVCRRHG